MTDIVIHHCTLRLVRRGGWSWGSDPQRLLNSAVRALPELIARKLADLWPDDIDREFAAPVRITVPVRPGDLLAATAEVPGAESPTMASSTSTLSERIEQAIRSTFQHEQGLSIDTLDVAKQEPPTPHAEEQAATPELVSGGTLLRVLLSWRDLGVLERRLAALSLPSLEAWHRRLLGARVQPLTGVVDATPEAIGNLVSAMAQGTSRSASDRATLLRRRLMIAVEVVAQLRVLPNHPAVQEALDRVFPLDRAADVEELTSATPFQEHAETLTEQPPILQAPAKRAIAPRHTQLAGPSPPQPLRQAEVYVSSALPFLLLGPLLQIGYLDTLTATLEAADLLSELPRFATALAYKVLDPPERGWRRSPATVAAAAVFAGVEEPVAGSDLVEFARKVSTHLSPLDAVLADTLIAGHSPTQPLLLQRADLARDSGLLLVDVEGLFPIAWSTELESLFPNLSGLGSAVVLIPQTTAAPELLARLDAGAFRFITDAPPTRHESWRPLRQARANRWWTNDRTNSPASLIQLAQHLTDASEETDALWHALAVERPCVPLGVDSALDRSLTLAAAVALGTIAWELWREREPVAPQLALQRFRDLDARVSFGQHSVRVRLPLGRRYQDLYEHGLLVDVPGLPWFGERVLQFSGG